MIRPNHIFSIVESALTEMLWLENPGGLTSYKKRWTMHKILDGPGVHFEPVELRANNRYYDVIATSQFWMKKVSLVWHEGEQQNRWDLNPAKQRILDDTLGQAFDIRAVDLNNDGKKDFLVTYNAPKNGTAYAYELIGDDFR